MFLRATDGPDGDGKSLSSVGNDIRTRGNQGEIRGSSSQNQLKNRRPANFFQVLRNLSIQTQMREARRLSLSVLKDVEGCEDGTLREVLNVKRELRNHIRDVVPIHFFHGNPQSSRQIMNCNR